MDCQKKILSTTELGEWRQKQRNAGKTVVVTNGCFDLLHAGHVVYLRTARQLGDILLIGLNGDQSVRTLKGEGRPINTQDDRALVLSELECVSAVSVFVEPEATQFLRLARPDVYVKGGDYTVETLNADERKVVEEAGGKIMIVPMVPGRSTTSTVAKVLKLESSEDDRSR